MESPAALLAIEVEPRTWWGNWAFGQDLGLEIDEYIAVSR